jgi:hypothetical protein
MAAVLVATADLAAAGTPSAVHTPSVGHIPLAVLAPVLRGVRLGRDRSAGRFLRNAAGAWAQV